MSMFNFERSIIRFFCFGWFVGFKKVVLAVRESLIDLLRGFVRVEHAKNFLYGKL